MEEIDVWSRLDPRIYREVLSSDTLDILEPLLERTSEDIPIKDDAITLGKIFCAIKADQLHKKSFRRIIYDMLYDDELRDLGYEIGIKEKSNRESIIKELLKIPWDNNDKAQKIVNILGVPSFTLNMSIEKIDAIPPISYPLVCKLDQFNDKSVSKQTILECFEGIAPYKTLKPYQSEVFAEAKKYIERQLEKFIINMPTGTGKTRTAMQLVTEFLREHHKQSVVWIADKQELIDQACLEFNQIWDFVGDRPIQIERWYSGHRASKNIKDPIFLATTYGTLTNRMERILELNIGLVVVDEAHMAVAPKWNILINNLIRPRNKTKVMGLTATPIRTGDKETVKLIEYFNENIIPIRNYEGRSLIKWLENKKYLAAGISDSISTEIKIKLSKKEREKIEKYEGDFSVELLEKLSKDVAFNKMVVNKLVELIREGKKILLFGVTIDHSKMLVAWLRMKGFSAYHLDGNTDKKLRRACIKSFKKGDLEVLSNYGVLTTGFDAPKVDCVFIARPTTSAVLYQQMVGRGLRGPELGGTGICKIIDIDINFNLYGNRRLQCYEDYINKWKEHECF